MWVCGWRSTLTASGLLPLPLSRSELCAEPARINSFERFADRLRRMNLQPQFRLLA